MEPNNQNDNQTPNPLTGAVPAPQPEPVSQPEPAPAPEQPTPEPESVPQPAPQPEPSPQPEPIPAPEQPANQPAPKPKTSPVIIAVAIIGVVILVIACAAIAIMAINQNNAKPSDPQASNSQDSNNNQNNQGSNGDNPGTNPDDTPTPNVTPPEPSGNITPSTTTDEDALIQNDMKYLASLFNQYLINNSNVLPPIENGLITGLEAYIPADLQASYTLYGHNAFTGSPYDGNESSFSTIPTNEMHIFYKSTCDAENRITPSVSEQNFAIIHSSADYTAYYCVTSIEQ